MNLSWTKRQKRKAHGRLKKWLQKYKTPQSQAHPPYQTAWITRSSGYVTKDSFGAQEHDDQIQTSQAALQDLQTTLEAYPKTSTAISKNIDEFVYTMT